MKSSDLKEYILEQGCVDTILEDLGCGNVVCRGEYYSCSNPDGNNTSAVTVYLNENLTVVNYTRCIAKNKRSTDLFDLISFYRDCSFPEALKYAHELLGLDYYQEREEPCESLQILRMLKDMQSGKDDEKDEPLKPISKDVLQYFLPYGNKMWEDEGISLQTQQDFSIMYDPNSNYIAIPVYDSVGALVGIKGRYFGEPDEMHSRFIYLEKCNKSKILYGLWENKEYIKNSKYLIVVESEKSVLKLAELGYRNVVATGGKTISKYQVELITRSGCAPIFAYDQDVGEDELREIADMFMDGIPVYAMLDKENILCVKESPPDDTVKFQYLMKNHVYKISKGGDVA